MLVDEKENDGRLSFDTFDLTSIMSYSALMGSQDLELDNQIISNNGKIFIISTSITFVYVLCFNS